MKTCREMLPMKCSTVITSRDRKEIGMRGSSYISTALFVKMNSRMILTKH